MSAPVAPSVIVNNPDAVPSKLDANTGLNNNDSMIDRTLQAVPTAPNQLSDYVAAYLVYAANLLGYNKVERVKPGMLKLKEPNTIMGIFKKYETIWEYTDRIQWFSPIVY